MSSSGEVLSPAVSAKFIAENSKNVTISEEGISRLSKEIIENLKTGKMEMHNFRDDGLHPSGNEPNVVDWTFVADTLNFCFWTPGNNTKWNVEGQTGYFGLVAALNRAIKEGYDMTNPKYYISITEDQLSHIMRSDDGKTAVPLLSTRVECLHEVGKVLFEKYNGTFENCLKEANKSAVSLLNLIVSNFPCFRDEAMFEGQKVSFYKRAQILVADLWLRFSGKGRGDFADIDKITMFADYRVPQALVHFGVMKYSSELLHTLKKDKILENGSREEVEIRGCSIHAVELVRDNVKEILLSENNSQSCQRFDVNYVNSAMIDYFLWCYRRQYAKELEDIPFHKVFCKYY